jgi:hypothetical protein
VGEVGQKDKGGWRLWLSAPCPAACCHFDVDEGSSLGEVGVALCGDGKGGAVKEEGSACRCVPACGRKELGGTVCQRPVG